MRKALAAIIILLVVTRAYTQHIDVPHRISAFLREDTLTVENQLLRHRYLWNGGNIMLLDMADKRSGKVFQVSQPKPDLLLPEDGDIAQGSLQTYDRQTYPQEKPFREIEISYSIGKVAVKRCIRIYPESPAIKHIFYFRGSSDLPYWEWSPSAGLEMIEQRDKSSEELPRMATVPFSGNHWKFRAISFREATDHHDNPVEIREFFNYRQKEHIKANMLIAQNKAEDLCFFVLKEAPIGDSQAFYPGFDFQADHQALTMHGLGASPQILSDHWLQGYGFAIGLTGFEQWEQTRDLITYQKQLRRFVPARDGMVLANTWGDRSKDSRMTEAFILSEIDKASALGITHLQLDDGWQQGLSRNSASKSGMKWDDWHKEDWVPHNERFPNGLEPIVSKGKEKGVEICLWFNPSKENDYALWERDAGILIDFYRRYGIRTFKIDGMSFAGKTSEANLRKLFEKVMGATNGEAVFNMDVTAGKRLGYHFFQEYGNIFLENRYTDWSNYYPYRTLRNLWLLSAYMPAERLQIEFLNVFRNQGMYPQGDLLSPFHVGLPYAFAVTMGAQPLAWMELSGLKEGKEELAALIHDFQAIAADLHTSVLLPIGEEPDGFSWSGFQALQDGKARYLMIYREHTDLDTASVELPYQAKNIRFLFGSQPIAYSLTPDGASLHISFDQPHQFAVFRLE